MISNQLTEVPLRLLLGPRTGRRRSVLDALARPLSEAPAGAPVMARPGAAGRDPARLSHPDVSHPDVSHPDVSHPDVSDVSRSVRPPPVGVALIQGLSS